MLTDHTNVMVKKKDCQIRHLPLDKSHFITEICIGEEELLTFCRELSSQEREKENQKKEES